MYKDLNNNVYYIGTDDMKSELFESQYIIPEGIAYNSYLIRDEKVAILDTADAVMGEEWKANLMESLDGRTPDYLVIHHMEPDHSALAAWVLEEWKDVTLVASQKAIQMMPLFFEGIDLEGRTLAVKDGDTLDLGRQRLRFIAAPMIHWPEVMMSYEETEGTLYSADAFGKFGALAKCGFRGCDDDDWTCEGRRYYFNIVGKYGVQVKNLLAKISQLDVRSIRPLHGPILEEDLDKYISLYTTWSNYEAETEGVFIAVASIHGNTLHAAERLRDMLQEKGVKVAFSDLCRSDFAENVEDAFRYPRLVLAASSYDGGLFTPMYNFLHLLKSKGYSNRKVALMENGSWAPCAARVMRAELEGMKNVEVVENTLTLRGCLKQSDMPAMQALAEAIKE